MTISESQERARASRKDAGGARREELVQAAAECFDDLGYSATTVELIAARAQTSRPTFYAYFRSKDEILLALVDRVGAELEAAQSLEGMDTGDPREVIAATIHAYADAVFANGSLVSLFDAMAPVREDVAEIWDRTMRRTHRRYTNYLAALDPGTVDLCLPPAELVRILNDTIHHGAKRVARGSAAERERFIADQIRITERLVGFAPS
ncbi:TetR/AcrR family transcriptional regulator [Tsukamurella sp. PLM1]|uniref:TetR/AcrR family transcriptional regulator n=1 Tax=Tsukamurella sp. PLM1 TaxID=2929795 RepID=UPI0020536A38|nr:TetR/AcrR family transcriptional regulator [Tsukamurella sp. PLM1]BDH57124.1 HTH-type transcriptional regulator EthR [Tsukamurella sp. PLM1]